METETSMQADQRANLLAQQVEVNRADPAVRQVIALYERMGSVLHYRSTEEYQEFLRPWQVDENGFDQSKLGKEDAQAFGPMVGGYGAYLKK